MSRTEKRIAFVLAVAVVWVFILVLDLLLIPDFLKLPPPLPSQANDLRSYFIAGYLLRLVLLPLVAILVWPLGVWLWRTAQRETKTAERNVVYGLAVLTWLMGALVVFALVSTWLGR